MKTIIKLLSVLCVSILFVSCLPTCLPTKADYKSRFAFYFFKFANPEYQHHIIAKLDTFNGKNEIILPSAFPRRDLYNEYYYLENNYNCEVVGTTAHLSNRPLLREDMQKYMDKADVMLTELKAAAVDVATKDAIAHGLDVVYCDNIPVAIDDSYPDLAKSVIDLVDSAIDDFNKSS